MIPGGELLAGSATVIPAFGPEREETEWLDSQGKGLKYQTNLRMLIHEGLDRDAKRAR
jgi:hypothetical protein